MNPDNNILILELEDPFSPTIAKGKNGLLSYNTTDINFKAIEFLIRELSLRREEKDVLVYETYYYLLRKNVEEIKGSTDKLNDLLSKDPENIAAWTALAMCNLVLSNTDQVKNSLKVFEKSSLNIKYYNDYERGMLLFSFNLMMQSRLDKAEELIVTVLEKINKAQSSLISSSGIQLFGHD